MFTGGPCAREDACAGGWCVHGPRTRYTMCVLQGMACTLLGHQCVYLSPSFSLSLSAPRSLSFLFTRELNVARVAWIFSSRSNGGSDSA